MIRAEGGLVNPYRSSLLEGHIAALSGDPEPRRARTCPLPHIRQANVHVMQGVYGLGARVSNDERRMTSDEDEITRIHLDFCDSVALRWNVHFSGA